jgi:hypothetical protein
MNETDVPDGDNMMTVFYRLKPVTQGSVPFEELKYKSFDATQPWEALNTEAEKNSQK